MVSHYVKPDHFVKLIPHRNGFVSCLFFVSLRAPLKSIFMPGINSKELVGVKEISVLSFACAGDSVVINGCCTSVYVDMLLPKFSFFFANYLCSIAQTQLIMRSFSVWLLN